MPSLARAGRAYRAAKVQSQNNLQSRNTTMITILAAIYVPLAFVTVSAPLLSLDSSS